MKKLIALGFAAVILTLGLAGCSDYGSTYHTHTTVHHVYHAPVVHHVVVHHSAPHVSVHHTTIVHHSSSGTRTTVHRTTTVHH